MILSRLSFPSPPSALCTVFGERGLPCPVTSVCLPLSPCPVSSPPSPSFLPWGALGGGGACCCREGVEEGEGEGEWEWVHRTLPPRSPCGGRSWLKGAPCWCRCAWCGWFWPLASAGPHIPVCLGRSCMLFAGMMALAGVVVVDHARSARRQSMGLEPGLVPLRTRPRSWGEGEVRPHRPPSPGKCLLSHHPGPGVPRATYLGCPLLSWAELGGGGGS